MSIARTCDFGEGQVKYRGIISRWRTLDPAEAEKPGGVRLSKEDDMRKLFTLVFTLAVAFSLVMPAFAQEPDHESAETVKKESKHAAKMEGKRQNKLKKQRH